MIRAFILIWFVLINLTGEAQSNSVEKDVKSYLLTLAKQQVDSVILLEKGCSGDSINGKLPGKTIFVLSAKKGRYQLQKFDASKKYAHVSLNFTGLFQLAVNHRPAFLDRERYERELIIQEKTLKFIPPSPIDYCYEMVKIDIPAFQSEAKLIEKEFDNKTYLVTNEKWYNAVREVLDNFEKEIIKSGF